MKFLMFAMFDVAKAAEVAQASDKVVKLPGRKTLAMYVCQGIPFPPSVPPNKMVVISVNEVESNEALGAVSYPLALAGATIWSVPVQEMPVGSTAEEEKKYKG